MNVFVADEFLTHHVLNSLVFEQLNISYNAQVEKLRGIDEMITICFQQKVRMSRNNDEGAHLAHVCYGSL